MSDLDQDQIKQREHWQALAEQLGLAPEAEPASPTAPPSSEPAAPIARIETSEHRTVLEVKKPIVVPEKARGQESGVRSQESLRPDATSHRQGAPVQKPLEEATGEQAVTEREVAREKSAVSETSGRFAEEKEKPASGRRRRGRRSAKGSAEPREEILSGQSAGEGADSEGTSERGRRRGRGRQKRPTDAEPAQEPPQEDRPVEEDTEEVDTLSDWNVPSWSELIASLHRPER